MYIEDVKKLYEMLGEAIDQVHKGDLPTALFRAYGFVEWFVENDFNKGGDE